MGLAPYGRPSLLDDMRKIVRLHPDGGFALDLRFFRHHREDIAYQWMEGSPEFGDLFSPALEQLLGPRRHPADPLEDRHRDIARSAQALYEEAFFNLLDVLQKRCGLTDLALAGGCAMNSVANGKVRRMTQFRRVYVQAAAGDAGGAIGAAYAVWHKLGGKRSFVMNHAYWGPGFGAPDIAQLIAAHRSELSATEQEQWIGWNVDHDAESIARVVCTFRHASLLTIDMSHRSDLTKLPAFDKTSKCWHAVIETPKGSHHKFDFEPKLRCFELKRTLPEGMTFPPDFGFIPSTLGDDGDPLDVLVVLDFPASLGTPVTKCVLSASSRRSRKKRDATGFGTTAFWRSRVTAGLLPMSNPSTTCGRSNWSRSSNTTSSTERNSITCAMQVPRPLPS